MSEKNIVYFDLETQRSLSDVAHEKEKLQISVAVTYSTKTGEYHIFSEEMSDQLADQLLKADLVVGWNHQEFDYPVLQPYVLQNLLEMTVNLDMMLAVQDMINGRLKLENVASETLGTGKSGDGLDAIRWWQDYCKERDFAHLRKIAEYCAYDVKVTRLVHEYAVANGHIKYKDRTGQSCELAVDWK